MKLKRLHLKNFRCFEDLVIQFDDRLTVIIAENGAGKTAVLDAIAIGFGRLLTKLPGVVGRLAKDTDVRVQKGEKKAPFLALAWEAETYEGQALAWSGGRRRDAAVKTQTVRDSLKPELLELVARGSKELDDYALRLIEADVEDRPYFLPVIAYYGTDRAIRDEVQRRRGFKKAFSRFEALSGALDPSSRFRSAFEWFNAMEDAERRERELQRDFDYRLPELDAVRAAIIRLLPPGFSKPRTEIRPLRFVIDREMPDGAVRTLRISQLSDGYRVVLGLAMDFARRMAQANSQLLPQGLAVMNPLDLPAIALIDEVDLHLHPKWQQHVLTDLMQVFKNTQFIVTTHSPQVLTAVKRENIRILDDSGVQLPLREIKGTESAMALNEVMGVNSVPPVEEAQWQADYIAKIENGTHEDAQGLELRMKLLDFYGEQHPVVRDADRLIRFQGFKLRNQSAPRD